MPSGDIEKQVKLKLIADDADYGQTMQRVSSDTSNYGRSVEGLNRQLTDLRSTMGGVAQQFGAGGFGNLLGAATLAGATLAVSGIIAQAMRMAYAFEETSAKVAANLTLGTSTSVGAAYNAVQAAATSPVVARYGFNPLQAVQAMTTYQAAAGANLEQTVAAEPTLLRYARGYGLTPDEVATAVGGATRLTRETAGTAAAGLFGGAEEAGQLGRDIRSYLGVTQALLSHLALGAPGTTLATGQVGQIVADIAKAGGVYSTPQGVMTVTGGLSSLTQGNQGDMQRTALALRAGLSVRDIILGENTPRNQARMAQEIQREGGGWNNPRTWAMLVSMMGQDQARAFLDLPGQDRDRLLRDMASGKSAHAIDAEKRAMGVMATPFGDVAQAVAKLNRDMMDMGKGLLDKLAPMANNVSNMADYVIKYLPEIWIALVAGTIASTFGGSKLLGGGLKMLGKLLPAMGETAAAGGLGELAAALAAGGGLAIGAGALVGASVGTLAGKNSGGNPMMMGGFGAAALKGLEGLPIVGPALLKAIQTGEGSYASEWTGGNDATKTLAHPASSNALGWFQFLSTTAAGSVPSWFTKQYGSLTTRGGDWNYGSPAWNAWIHDVKGVQEQTAAQHAAGLMAYYNSQKYSAIYGKNNVKAIFAGWLGGQGGIDAFFSGRDVQEGGTSLRSYVAEHYANYLKNIKQGGSGFAAGFAGGGGGDDWQGFTQNQNQVVHDATGKKYNVQVTVKISPSPAPTTGGSRTNSLSRQRPQ